MAKQQIIFGLHPVMALLKKHPERVLSLEVHQTRQDKRMGEIMALAATHDISVHFTSRASLDQHTHEANHQGVLARCQPVPTYAEADLKDLLTHAAHPPFVLILDGVQDPHNLGACFRSADAAGVDVIIAPKDKSASLTPTVSKVACGATETVPFVAVTNLVRTIESLKSLGIWVYGAAAEAEQSLYQTNLQGPVALVLGSEGSGLRRLTQEHCDALLHLPMRGSVTSLNVSVAAGIILFEVLRQRG